MQENNFEKQVRNEMEALKLRPSADVWNQLEAGLKRKKRRSVLVYFVLFTGLALLGYLGISEFYQSSSPIAGDTTNPNISTGKENSTTQSSTGTTSPNNLNAKENTSVSSIPVEVNDQVDQSVTAQNPSADSKIPGQQQPGSSTPDIRIPGNKITNAPVKEGKAQTSGSVTGIHEPSNPGKSSTNTRRNLSKNKLQEGNKKPNATLTPPQTAGVNGKATTSHDDDQTVNIPKDRKRGDSSNSITSFKSPVTAIADSNQTDIAQQMNPDLVQDSSNTRVDSMADMTQTAGPIRVKSNKRIRWGFDVFTGISGRRDEALPVLDASKSAAQYDFLTGAGPITPGAPLPIRPPSVVNHGPSFRIGITAEKSIGKRSSIRSGLQYSFRSDKIKLGQTIDTNIVYSNALSQDLNLRAIYQTGETKSYTNRFHFIQVPLFYQLRFGKGKSWPVTWQIGLTAGYMIQTNALIYDTLARGSYYPDKSAFRRFHLSVGTALSVQPGKQRKFQWSIGPEISFDTRKLLNSAFDKRQYMYYGGITGKFLLPVRKK